VLKLVKGTDLKKRSKLVNGAVVKSLYLDGFDKENEENTKLFIITRRLKLV
jgi:hypothetical protein